LLPAYSENLVMPLFASVIGTVLAGFSGFVWVFLYIKERSVCCFSSNLPINCI